MFLCYVCGKLNSSINKELDFMLYSFLFGTILLSTKATEENKTNISTAVLIKVTV